VFSAVFATNFSDIIITFIATFPAIITSIVMISKRMKRVEGTVDSIHSDIQTNHGKKPFEYLEMIADVQKEQIDNKLDMLENRRLLVEHAQMLVEHTEHDSKNFNELKELILELNKESN
jgi:formylmethanofuran dehydrogenase subunit B